MYDYEEVEIGDIVLYDSDDFSFEFAVGNIDEKFYYNLLGDGYLKSMCKPIDNDRDVNKVKNINVTHYDLWKGFEAIDVMKSVLTPEEYIGYLKGNIMKYQLRLGKKDDVSKELQKIKDYTRELNSLLKDI